MIIYLLQTPFALLLFALLVVCCTLHLPAKCAHSSGAELCPSDQNGFFKKEEIKKALESNVENFDEKNVNVKKVFLVASDQSMIALAETNIDKDNDKLFFFRQILEKKDGKWCKKTAQSKLVKWEVKDGKTPNTFSEKGTSAVVVKGNNLFFFVVNDTSLQADFGSSTSIENNRFPIFVGKVLVNSEKMFDENILFEKKGLVPLSGTSKDMQELKKELPITSLTGSYAFLTEGEEKKVVLVVNSETNNGDSSKKNVAALYCMDEATNKLEFMYVTNLDNCIPHFIPWDKKVFMIPTGCANCGTYKVNESADMKEWTNSNGIFSLLDTLCGGKAFTTTHIGENRVGCCFF